MWRKVALTPEGFIPGVLAAGINGETFPDATPSRRGVIYTTESHEILVIKDYHEHAVGEVVLKGSGCIVPPDESFEGHATRIGPWPARVDSLVVGLGTDEQVRIHDIHRALDLSYGKAAPPRVTRFLEWMSGATPLSQSEDLQAEVLKNGTVVWYCRTAEKDALWRAIRDVAVQRLVVAEKEDELDASWWLERAAINDEDVYRAQAGLAAYARFLLKCVENGISEFVIRGDAQKALTKEDDFKKAMDWLKEERQKARALPSR